MTSFLQAGLETNTTFTYRDDEVFYFVEVSYISTYSNVPCIRHRFVGLFYFYFKFFFMSLQFYVVYVKKYKLQSLFQGRSMI